jgi:hypothetical protein
MSLDMVAFGDVDDQLEAHSEESTPQPPNPGNFIIPGDPEIDFAVINGGTYRRLLDDLSFSYRVSTVNVRGKNCY